MTVSSLIEPVCNDAPTHCNAINATPTEHNANVTQSRWEGRAVQGVQEGAGEAPPGSRPTFRERLAAGEKESSCPLIFLMKKVELSRQARDKRKEHSVTPGGFTQVAEAEEVYKLIQNKHGEWEAGKLPSVPPRPRSGALRTTHIS